MKMLANEVENIQEVVAFYATLRRDGYKDTVEREVSNPLHIELWGMYIGLDIVW